MMARNRNVPFKGRIQKRKTYHLQIVTFGLQRAAGPYRGANGGRCSIHRPCSTYWTGLGPSLFACHHDCTANRFVGELMAYFEMRARRCKTVRRNRLRS